MSDLDFKCLKCGTCCRNLLEDLGELRKGLVLTPKEAKLFASDVVVPQMAIGMKEPKIFLLFQLSVNECPYVSEKNECGIYENRPLICRSFPFIVEEISNKCKVFSYRRIEQNYYDIYPMLEMREANTKINKYLYSRFKKHFRKGIKVWEYDLAKREWVFRKKHDKLPLSWVH